MSVLEVLDLEIEYASREGPVPAVRGVSFSIERGQVVVIAPTTVLTRQHFATFKRRFEGTGISVGMLSRLVKPSEAKQVKAALAEGVRDVEALERDVRRAAGKFVSERTRRRPMIVPVVMEA